VAHACHGVSMIAVLARSPARGFGCPGHRRLRGSRGWQPERPFRGLRRSAAKPDRGLVRPPAVWSAPTGTEPLGGPAGAGWWRSCVSDGQATVIAADRAGGWSGCRVASGASTRAFDSTGVAPLGALRGARERPCLGPDASALATDGDSWRVATTWGKSRDCMGLQSLGCRRTLGTLQATGRAPVELSRPVEKWTTCAG
jgi:hypothetical protein